MWGLCSKLILVCEEETRIWKRSVTRRAMWQTMLVSKTVGEKSTPKY